MTIRRTSIFDRYSEQRIAREALERESALAAQAEAAARDQAPAPTPVTPIKPLPSRISLGGFDFELPGGFSFRDVEMSIDCDGQPVALKIQRRHVAEADQLDALFERAEAVACAPHAGLRIIRRYDCLFAGSRAKAVDFSFMDGAQHRHGRFVGAIIPLHGADQRQWLSISCLIDPSQPALATWLVDFDNMLGAVANA